MWVKHVGSMQNYVPEQLKASPSSFPERHIEPLAPHIPLRAAKTTLKPPHAERVKRIHGLRLVNEMMQTDVAGVYAAGDIRHGSPRQVAAAVGDGTIASISAQKYVREVAGE